MPFRSFLKNMCNENLDKSFEKYTSRSSYFSKVAGSSAVSSNFFGSATFSTSLARRKTIVLLGSLWGSLQALPSGVQGQSIRRIWLFCILDSSKHRSHGSAFCGTSAWNVICCIIFYTFESLGIKVWHPKPTYRIQNSFGYNTGLLAYITVQTSSFLAIFQGFCLHFKQFSKF